MKHMVRVCINQSAANVFVIQVVPAVCCTLSFEGNGNAFSRYSCLRFGLYDNIS